MEPEARRELVEQTADVRQKLTQEIKVLSEQRATYLRERVAAAGGAKASLDQQLFDTVKDQTRESGIEYEADALVY